MVLIIFVPKSRLKSFFFNSECLDSNRIEQNCLTMQKMKFWIKVSFSQISVKLIKLLYQNQHKLMGSTMHTLHRYALKLTSVVLGIISILYYHME